MILNSETWNREVCELIDYDSPNINRETTEIKSSGYLYRTDDDSIIFDNEVNKEYDQHLLDIIYKEGKYDLIFNDFKQDDDGIITTPNSAWFLLKKSKIKQEYDKYKIHQGEIIKIGRIMTRIKDIKFNKKEIKNNNININEREKNKNNKEEKNISKYISTTEDKSEISEISTESNKYLLKNIENSQIIKKEENQLNTECHESIKDIIIKRNRTNTDLPEKIQILSLQNNIINKNQKTKLNFNSKKLNTTEKLCRICYGEENDPKENPIIQPCRCSGSCKYIHLKCLKHWIMTKSCTKIDENEFCCVYIFSETECELCKSKLPDLVLHNNKLYSLLDFSDDFKNYLILECLTLDKENNKFLYIISLEKKGDIKIGRGQVCDILFSDASVSRIHCVLSVEGKSVFIRDYGSKFGTLILVQSPIINLTENLPLFIQVGRSFLNFIATDANPKFFGCCGVSEKPMICYYYQQNQKQIRDNRIFTVKTEEDNGNDININVNEEISDDKKEEIIINEENNENNKEKNKNDKLNYSNKESNNEIIIDINDDMNKRGDIYEDINDEIVI